MIFNSAKQALNRFIVRSDENYSSLGAICIGLDAGVDISTSNDGYDDVDTLCDIEKILNDCITRLEKRIIIYHTSYGMTDSMINGRRIKGSYSKFKHKITPINRVNDKVVREQDKLNSKSFFSNYLLSIERTIENALIDAGYISYDHSLDDFFEE